MKAPLATGYTYEGEKPAALFRTEVDAGRTAEGEPENQMEARPQSLQAAERGRTTVPETQGPPTHLHKIRQARRDVSKVPELRIYRQNGI